MKLRSKTSIYLTVRHMKTLISTFGRDWRIRLCHRTIWTNPPLAPTASSHSSCSRRIWRERTPAPTLSASSSWSIWLAVRDNRTQLRLRPRKTQLNSKKRLRLTSLCSHWGRWSQLWPRTVAPHFAARLLLLASKRWWTMFPTESQSSQRYSSRAWAATVSLWW